MNICSAPFAPSFWVPHLLASIPGVCTDTFDRADNATSLGTADSGQVWTTAGSQWAISSNLAKSNGAAFALARLECYNPDVTVSVALPVNGAKVGLIARYSGGTYLRCWFNGGNVELHSVSGTATLLGSAAQAANNGVTLKLVLVGTSIDVYVDNTLLFNVTSSFNQFAGTQFGLYSDSNLTARFNNFNVVMPQPVGVTDDFNRADDATSLGTATSGHVWRAHAGTWGIQTNRARQVTGVFSAATVISNRADCAIQVTLPVNSGNGGGLAFRVLDTNNLLWVQWNVGSLFLQKRVAGVGSTLTSTVFANANGQVLKVVLLGSSIEVYVGGVLKLTATDSFNMLATQHGLLSGSSTVIRYDDFSIVA